MSEKLFKEHNDTTEVEQSHGATCSQGANQWSEWDWYFQWFAVDSENRLRVLANFVNFEQNISVLFFCK